MEADVTPHMAVSAGVAARVQGLKRYYALMLAPGGKIRLIKVWYDTTSVLAEADFAWEFGKTYQLSLEVKGGQLTGSVDRGQELSAEDQDHPYLGGGIALVCEEGRNATQVVTVRPA